MKGNGEEFWGLFLSLACCYEIMWKCFCCSLVTHEWLCLEHILREHMLLVLLMLNYLFLCCFPAAPASVRFWSVSVWLRLHSLRIMPKAPTNSSSESLNTTTSVLFCRYLGAYLIKLGGKIVRLVANFYWGAITLEAQREFSPNRKSEKWCPGLCRLLSSFRVWGLVLEGFPSPFSVRLNPWQLSSIVLRPAAVLSRL